MLDLQEILDTRHDWDFDIFKLEAACEHAMALLAMVMHHNSPYAVYGVDFGKGKGRAHVADVFLPLFATVVDIHVYTFMRAVV